MEINKVSGGRIAKAEEIDEAAEAAREVTAEIVRSNESLDDFENYLNSLQQQHDIYKVKRKRVKAKMNKLLVEL